MTDLERVTRIADELIGGRITSDGTLMWDATAEELLAFEQAVLAKQSMEIDAPRGFFMGLELGFKNLEDMRDHMDICGYDYSMWPYWAKVETGHITNAGKAIIVWSMMQHASPINT